MDDIRKLVRVQLFVILLFIIFKLFRKSILATDPPRFIKIFLFSFPNFCEGIIGVITLTMLALLFTRRLRINNEYIYIITTFVASVYVITQELKIHNLGGENIYDPNDIIFSILGLLTGYIILRLIKPKILNMENPSKTQ